MSGKRYPEGYKEKLLKRIAELKRDEFSITALWDKLLHENWVGTDGNPITLKAIKNLMYQNDVDSYLDYEPDAELPEEIVEEMEAGEGIPETEPEEDDQEPEEEEVEAESDEVNVDEETGLPIMVYNFLYEPGLTDSKRVALMRAYYDN